MNKKIFFHLPLIASGIFLVFIFTHGVNWRTFFSSKVAVAATFQTNTNWTSASTGTWAYPTTWGLSGGLTKFSDPTGVTVDSSGYIYIADGLNGNFEHSRIVVLNPDGTASTTYGGPGTTLDAALGGTFSPIGLAISSTTGRIYAADGAGNRVVVLNPDGTLYAIYSDVNFNSVIGIALSPTGLIYVINQNNGPIVVLNADGTASTTWGTYSPDDIDVSPITGKIFVSSANSDQITILNPDGTFFAKYSGVPSGLTFAPDGTIYFVYSSSNNGNGYLNYLVVLNPDGTASTTYSLPSGLTGLGGVALSPTGKIYTTNPTVGNVTVLNANGTQNTVYDGLALPPSFVPVAGTDYPGSTDSTSIVAGTVTLAADETVSNFDLYSGATLNLNGHTLTIATGGTFNNYGGTLTLNGGRIQYDGVWDTATSGPWNVSATWGGSNLSPVEGVDYPGSSDSAIVNVGTTTLTQDQSVKNLTLGTGGHLDLAGHTLNVYGNWTNAGGTLVYNPGNEGTVKFVSTNAQTISGNSVFENLVKTVSQGSSLSFEKNSTTTITGSLTLSGVSGSFLSIAPIGFTAPQYISTLANGGYAVAVDSSGNLYTYDHTNTVRKYDSTGSQTLSFAAGGFSGFYNAITVDDQQNIWVGTAGFTAFSIVPQVKEFSATGTLLESFGATGTGDGQFTASMQGIALDADGNIYISDSNGNRIEEFDASGNYLSQFGSYGQGDGQMWSPAGIAIDAFGNIYIADSGNNRIEKFDASGSYLSQFGTTGSLNGQMKEPWGLAIDSAGYIYVADRSNERIEAFDSNGVYKGQFGSSGTGNGQFNSGVLGLAIDSSNNVYTTDYISSRLEKFGYTNQPQFSILRESTSTGSVSLNYLSVSDSVNVSTPTFTCTNCSDGGNNINWNIIRPATHHHTIAVTLSTSSTSTLASLSIAPINATTTIAAITTYTATLLDQNGFVFSTSTLWLSSNPSVATLATTSTTTAVLTALSLGTTTISVSVGTSSTSTLLIVLSTSTTATSTIVATSTATTTPLTPKKITHSHQTATSTSQSPIIDQTIPLNGGLPSTATTSTTSALVVSTQSSSITPAISNVVSSISNSLAQSYQQTVSAPVVKAVADVVNSGAGSTVTKTISTTGIVAGASATITSVAFANPVTLPDIFLIPTRVFGLLIGALGIRRKNRPWGTVYDAITKRPIDPAYVSLINVTTGQEVASATTDFDGRYGFIVMPGTYKIVAQKTNYASSEHMKGKTFDEVYNDLYFGENIVVEKEGEVITKNIPMDPQKFDWNEFTKEKMHVNTFVKGKDITWAKISRILFWIGSLISLLGVLFSPKPYNTIIAVLYIVIYLLNYFVFATKKPGTLFERETRVPLSFAIVKIFREDDTEPMMKKIADQFGSYYALVPKGNYYLEIDKKNDDQSYTEVLKTPVMNIVKGIVNKNFIV